MQVDFKIVFKGLAIDVRERQSFEPIILEGAKIIWNFNREEKLYSINVVFSGIELIKDSIGVIMTTPELDEKVFKIATYFSNKIFLNTGIDAFSPKEVLYSSPGILPENEQERAIWICSKKQGFSDIPNTLDVVESLNIEDFSEDIKHSKAISFYADSKRIDNAFQKYELLYKVVEYFFPKKLDIH